MRQRIPADVLKVCKDLRTAIAGEDNDFQSPNLKELATRRTDVDLHVQTVLLRLVERKPAVARAYMHTHLEPALQRERAFSNLLANTGGGIPKGVRDLINKLPITGEAPGTDREVNAIIAVRALITSYRQGGPNLGSRATCNAIGKILEGAGYGP